MNRPHMIHKKEERVTHHLGTVNLPFIGHYSLGPSITRKRADAEKKKHVMVMLIVKDKQGNILLQKRASTKKDYPGYLTVSASGAVQSLETIETAARREAEEELGIKLGKPKPMWNAPAAVDPNNPHRLFFPMVIQYDGNFKADPKEVDASGTRYYHRHEVEKVLSENKATPPAQAILANYLEAHPRKVFVWDIDGVVLDSAKETHYMTIKALEKHKDEVQTSFGSTMKEYGYKEFFEDRPYSKKAHDYFIHGFMRNYHGRKAESISEKERTEFYSKYEPLMKKLNDAFYAIRKEMQEKNPKAWNDLNPVFKGIPEAMKKLREAGFEFAVVSSKDKKSIVTVLKHHNLTKYFDENLIFDTTSGAKREDQMKKLIAAVGQADYVVIDDIPDQHESSKNAFKGRKVKYLGATWGYGVGWNKHKYIQGVRSPRDIPSISGAGFKEKARYHFNMHKIRKRFWAYA